MLSTTINESFGLGANAGPQAITAGPNGQIWVANALGNQVQSLTTNGAGGGTLGTPITVGAAPEGITYATGGDIWVAEAGASAIGRVNPATGQYLGHFATPTANGQPTSITYDPANGLVYFTEGISGKIGYFDPATITSSADIHETSVVPTFGVAGSPLPTGITYNPADGNIWFVAQGTNQIGMFNPSHQSFNTAAYNLPNASANPRPTSLTVGSDGNLWFNEYATAQIGMFSPASRTFSGPYSLPAAAHAANPTGPIDGIGSGPDGNIYFGVGGQGQLGWFNPSTLTASANPSQAMTVVPVTQYASPWGITAGPDGNVWFTEYSGGGGGGAIAVAQLSTHVSVTTAPPSSVAAGAGFGLTVAVDYDTGVADAAYNGPVTVSLANGSGAGPLGGTKTVNAVHGVATFGGLTLGAAGSYRLQISAGAATSATTGAFNVTTTPTPTPTTPTPTTPTPTSPSPTSPSPTSTPTPPPAPTIIAERINAAYLRHNKKGKGIGKPVEEFVLTFSAAMDPATIGNAGNYRVAWASTRKVKRKLQTILHPIAVVSATVDPTNTTVTLVTSAQKTKFAKGGQIQIVSPGSIRSAAEVALAAPTVFLISPRARGISPVS